MSCCILTPCREPNRADDLTPRANACKLLIESVIKTSQADIAIYVDGGRGTRVLELLKDWRENERVFIHHMADSTVCHAVNYLCLTHPGYDWYGVLCDDMVIQTPGWDAYLMDCLDQSDGGLCVVSPETNFGDHVDIPFISKRFLEAIGGNFCNPRFDHYCWPTVIGLLGESTRTIVHAPKDKFYVHHFQLGGQSSEFSPDAAGLYKWLMYDYKNQVRRINDMKGIVYV